MTKDNLPDWLKRHPGLALWGFFPLFYIIGLPFAWAWALNRTSQSMKEGGRPGLATFFGFFLFLLMFAWPFVLYHNLQDYSDPTRKA